MDHQIAVPNGVVVKVVRREAPLPTLLVSDEVADEGAARVRRLRFFLPDGASSAELVSDHVQTEMLLRTRGRVDRGCLRHLYHRLMIAGLCCQARPATRARRVCVLGHGAGALSTFLSHVLRAAVTAVDSDASVVSLGRQFFGDCTPIHVCDAAEFVTAQKGSDRFDAVLIDINAAGEPLAAPPARLYSPAVVSALRRLSGLVIVNVLEGSEDDRHCVARAFASEFAHVMWLRAPLLCSNHVLVAGLDLTSAPSQLHLAAWLRVQHNRTSLGLMLGALRFGSSVIAEGLPRVVTRGRVQSSIHRARVRGSPRGATAVKRQRV